MSKMWFHVEFYFFKPDAAHRRKYYLQPHKLVEFKEYLGRIVNALGDRVERKFFLFEPNPHCFLALEIKGKINDRIIRSIMGVKRPNSIKAIHINAESHDETNGEAFLNFMNGAFDVIIVKDKKFCPPWLKKHPKDQQVLTHAVHCLMNSFTCSRPEEIRFYLRQAQTYTVGYKR